MIIRKEHNYIEIILNILEYINGFNVIIHFFFLGCLYIYEDFKISEVTMMFQKHQFRRLRIILFDEINF